MYFFFSLIAGLAILPLILHIKFPYFMADSLYLLRGIRIGTRLHLYKKRTPCYTILDCFLDRVKSHPNKKFIVFEKDSYSYEEADKISNKIARSLSENISLREGDTVAVFFGNEPLYVWVWLALAKLGCTAALINCNIRSKSLLHCFSCSDAKVLITAAELKDAVNEVLPTLLEQNVSAFTLSEIADTAGITCLSEQISKASDEPLPTELRSKVTFKSPALYIYTSGTTGLPKAAVINQERIWLASFLQSLSGVSSKDVIYIYLPLYHSSGFLMGLTGAIERGITVVLRRKFSASQFWDDCRRHEVTVIQYIGEIMRYLCNTPKKDNEKAHKVRIAIGNGIRTDTWVEFLDRFGDIRIFECYGATEGNTGFVNYVGKVGAIGRVTFLLKRGNPFTLVKYDTEREEPVRGPSGLCVEVPPGETGLLVAKITNRAPFKGYAKNTQQTERKKLRDVLEKGDVYFNSGDLLRLDQDGFIYFQDRIGDTFRWKGENVATTEVSDTLILLDLIEEANVYGVRVPGHEGRVGMAALKLKEGQEFDSVVLCAHMKACLPAYAQPRFLRIQNALDVTGTFKQTKTGLAEEGFNPNIIQDPLYFLDDSKKTYVPMTEEIFHSISQGNIRL